MSRRLQLVDHWMRLSPSHNFQLQLYLVVILPPSHPIVRKSTRPLDRRWESSGTLTLKHSTVTTLYFDIPVSSCALRTCRYWSYKNLDEQRNTKAERAVTVFHSSLGDRSAEDVCIRHVDCGRASGCGQKPAAGTLRKNQGPRRDPEIARPAERSRCCSQKGGSQPKGNWRKEIE